MTLPAAPPSPRLGAEITDLLRLALPVVLSRAGIMLLQIVDTIVVGRYSAQELAYQSIGIAPMITITVGAVAFMIGTLVLVAEAHGAGRDADCGAAWRRSLPWVVWLGLAAIGLTLLSEQALLLSGQTADLAAGGARVAEVMGLSVPGLLLFSTSTYFLEGLKRPMPGLLAMAAANVLNLVLNLVLVPGAFGLEPMGAVGSAWATMISRSLMGLGLFAYVWWMPERVRFGIRQTPPQANTPRRLQRRIGVTSALSGVIEDTGFTVLNLFAGWLGALAVAGFAIGVNLVGLVFMVAMGIGTATAVRVGNARGRGDHAGVARIGWLGFAFNTVVMALAGGVIALAPLAIMRVFTDDPALIALTAPVLSIVALMMVLDGGQVVFSNALRAMGDTWVPTALHTISYLMIMGPVGWVLAFPQGLGLRGLFLGMMIASGMSLLVLSLRFRRLSRPPVVRAVKPPA